MKKIVSSLVFSMALVAPMLSSAANVSQDLGTIVQGSSFTATHTNETFSDDFSLTIVPNSGVASTAINVNLLNGPSFQFTSGSLVNTATGVAAAYTISNGGAFNSIVATFSSLAAGTYKLFIGGNVTGGTATYNGNWQIIPTSAVPVPAAVWLFGSALIGLMGVSGRKKS